MMKSRGESSLTRYVFPDYYTYILRYDPSTYLLFRKGIHMSIDVHINSHTNRSDLGLTPLSVAERAAVWQALKDLMAVPVPLHGDYYTISLSFLDYKTFHHFEIWCNDDELSSSSQKRMIFFDWPEDILNEEKWLGYVLPSILNKNLWEQTGRRLMEEGLLRKRGRK